MSQSLSTLAVRKLVLTVLFCITATFCQATWPFGDPAYEGPEIGLVPELAGKHPRLLWDEDTLAEIKAFYDSAAGANLRTKLEEDKTDIMRFSLSTGLRGSEIGSQNMGTYRTPTLALYYLLTGDEESRDELIAYLEFLMDLSPWSSGSEINSSMPAANLLLCAAIAYDCLYNDLDPVFREEVREKIWYQVRALYNNGFLGKASAGGYWQQDPQNNHRFHRLVGLVAGTMAAYDGDPSQDYQLAGTMEELSFIHQYLPPDGSNHEGIGYIGYGHLELLLSMYFADRNLGTNYLEHSYFKNVSFFIAMASVPGLSTRFRYSDDNGGGSVPGSDHFLSIRQHDLKDVQAMVDTKGNNESGHAWLNLMLSTYPRPTGGSLDRLPDNVLFPDMGIAFFREGWEAGQKAAMFKASPLGGYRLNEYRDNNNFHGINVAHDDPDANMFVIWGGDDFVAYPDSYSNSKKSLNVNTILVNGHGQRVLWRGEGGQWSQPTQQGVSMKDFARITNWKDEDAIALVEGEAYKTYPNMSGMPSKLTRYRRALVWNKGKYIFTFDDIRSTDNDDITWLQQSKHMEIIDDSAGSYLSGEGDSVDPFLIRSNVAFSSSIVPATADYKGENLQYEQLQVVFPEVTNLQIISLHRLWDPELECVLDTVDADNATITITGDGFEDVWKWTAATDHQSPGTFKLLSSDGQDFDSEMVPWRKAITGLSYKREERMVNNWFGEYWYQDYPWLYRAGHGWFYAAEAYGNETNWFWTFEDGWLLMGRKFHPWVYSVEAGEWVKE